MRTAVVEYLAELEAETDRIWSEEPYEITLIRNNVTMTGAGSEGQYFSVLVHLEAFLMLLGPHVVFRILKLSNDPEFGLYELRRATVGILNEPFDQFEFLGDLGLASTHRLGRRYLELVADCDREEYVALTGAFLSYFNRVYQWIHLVFPWRLGEQVPKQPEDVTPEVQQAAQAWRQENPGG
jgi:hypothetical protein